MEELEGRGGWVELRKRENVKHATISKPDTVEFCLTTSPLLPPFFVPPHFRGPKVIVLTGFQCHLINNLAQHNHLENTAQ